MAQYDENKPIRSFSDAYNAIAGRVANGPTPQPAAPAVQPPPVSPTPGVVSPTPGAAAVNPAYNPFAISNLVVDNKAPEPVKPVGPITNMAVGGVKAASGAVALPFAAAIDGVANTVADAAGVTRPDSAKYTGAAIDTMKQGADQFANGTDGAGNGARGVIASMMGGQVKQDAPASNLPAPRNVPVNAAQTTIKPAAVPTPGAPGSAPATPGAGINVTRQANGVTEFSGQNVGAGPVAYTGDQGIISQMAGRGTVSSMPASSFTAGSPALSQQLGAARQAAMARGDVDAVRSSYQTGGGKFNGETTEDTAIRDTTAQVQRATGKRKAGLIQQLNAMTQNKDATAKNALAAQTGKIDNQIKQSDLATKQQLQTLQAQILAEKDPIKRKSLYDTFLTLSGKNPVEKVAIVDADTGQHDMMGQPIYKKMAVDLATKEFLTPPAPQSSQFIEGRTYTDAKGNKAVYKNGQFQPA